MAVKIADPADIDADVQIGDGSPLPIAEAMVASAQSGQSVRLG